MSLPAVPGPQAMSDLGRGESLTWTLIIIIRMKINDFIYIIQKWGQNLKKMGFGYQHFHPKFYRPPFRPPTKMGESADTQNPFFSDFDPILDYIYIKSLIFIRIIIIIVQVKLAPRPTIYAMCNVQNYI